MKTKINSGIIPALMLVALVMVSGCVTLEEYDLQVDWCRIDGDFVVKNIGTAAVQGGVEVRDFTTQTLVGNLSIKNLKPGETSEYSFNGPELKSGTLYYLNTQDLLPVYNPRTGARMSTSGAPTEHNTFLCAGLGEYGNIIINCASVFTGPDGIQTYLEMANAGKEFAVGGFKLFSKDNVLEKQNFLTYVPRGISKTLLGGDPLATGEYYLTLDGQKVAKFSCEKTENVSVEVIGCHKEEVGNMAEYHEWTTIVAKNTGDVPIDIGQAVTVKNEKNETIGGTYMSLDAGSTGSFSIQDTVLEPGEYYLSIGGLPEIKFVCDNGTIG